MQELCLDWRLGLRYFESCLADHEWALNAGNWAYCAGECGSARARGVPAARRAAGSQVVGALAATRWGGCC